MRCFTPPLGSLRLPRDDVRASWCALCLGSMTLTGTGIFAFCSCRTLREQALDKLGEYLEHENEQVRLMAALYLLRLPATQENLKMKEAMEMRSRYLVVDRKLKSAAEQAGLGV